MTLGWNILGILAWLILVLYLIFIVQNIRKRHLNAHRIEDAHPQYQMNDKYILILPSYQDLIYLIFYSVPVICFIIRFFIHFFA